MKTWKELFGDEKVAIECKTKEQFKNVIKFCGANISSSSFDYGYNCVCGYVDGSCGFEKQIWFTSNSYKVIPYEEFGVLFGEKETDAPLINPPLGVIPKKHWIINRKKELARAIHEYMSANDNHDNLTEWINELKELNDVQL